MNALAMPSSSRIAAESDAVCFWTKSPRMREERSATCWATLASSALSVGLAGCIPHDAISAGGTLRLARVVEIVQVGYRLAHGEKSLVRIERAAEEDRQEVGGAPLPLGELALQLGKTGPVVRLELGDPGVRAAKGLAVRGQHQHVGRELAIAGNRIEEQAQRVALGVDRPDADIGRNGGEQHVPRDDDIQRLAVERHVLRRMAMADDRAPVVLADAQHI